MAGTGLGEHHHYIAAYLSARLFQFGPVSHISPPGLSDPETNFNRPTSGGRRELLSGIYEIRRGFSSKNPASPPAAVAFYEGKAGFYRLSG
jgi:hypothetical protein